MVGLEKLALVGEKIVKDSDGRIVVKAIPIGNPMCIKHESGQIPEHEILSRALENEANAYVVGNPKYERGSPNFTPIQLYRILK